MWQLLHIYIYRGLIQEAGNCTVFDLLPLQLDSVCRMANYLLWLSFFLFSQLFHLSHGDVGTSASYSPPYTPTACYGDDGSQFPSNNLFAAAGEGIWDNGAACGRQYLVRCISAAAPASCVAGQTIQVKIVDRSQTAVSQPSRGGATMALSTTAFGAIANGSPASMNVEFQQV
ncbi:EG45-like domain containing protein isoform X2 [Diospyros lotus]|uniref:EG45-like domain containing protein isoform X2 n=1 Tax=Diospyros lotus TaxID=55363 RepID=UPI002258CC1B|nr:EG45-like domain containing protein isoform X2 [Diospyros lotus]